MSDRKAGVLLLTQPQAPELFSAALASLLPGVPIWADTADADPEHVAAILAWRLKAGMVAPYANLRLVCATAAGVEKITDAPDLAPHVAVMRVVDPLVNTGLGQYVLLMAWRHLRALALFEAQQRAHDWTRHRPPDPYSVTGTVLGLGEAGRTIAHALQVAGFDVRGWSRSPKTLAELTTFAGAAGLAPALRDVQYVVCALPLTAETRGLLDRRTLSLLPRGAYVINVARGGHLVEADLVPALDSGQLSGAVLDVFREEPLPPNHPFWRHPRILVTPHIAAETHPPTAAGIIGNAIRRFEAGLPVANVVDLSRGY